MWGELSASLSEISVAGIGETPLYPHTQLANTRQSWPPEIAGSLPAGRRFA